jgi:branched-chain amino acid transport system substrate-binding protein
MLTKRNLLVAGAVSAVALAAPAMAQTVVGVTDDTIKIGNTMPYSGPASAYGQIGQTMAAYFKKVNAEGGINGRQVEFITYDDAYSPPKTVEQVRRLVEQDEVALLYGVLGTPPNSAIHRYVNAKKVPHLFISTGATKWGDPENFPWTMGWQPNYQTEGKIYGEYVRENMPDAKIGVLYQNDDYGKDYLEGFKEGLGDMTSQIVSEQSYEVADPTVDSQIINLQSSGADVFFFDDPADLASSVDLADLITDFTQADGDTISFNEFDADTTTDGEQAFAFIGDAAFSGTAGELRYVQDNGQTVIEMDRDGDGMADLFMALEGTIDLTINDFAF